MSNIKDSFRESSNNLLDITQIEVDHPLQIETFDDILFTMQDASTMSNTTNI